MKASLVKNNLNELTPHKTNVNFYMKNFLA